MSRSHYCRGTVGYIRYNLTAGGAIRNENADSTIYITDSDFVSNSAKTVVTTVTTTMLINGASVKNKKSTTKETIGYGGAISTKGNVVFRYSDKG